MDLIIKSFHLNRNEVVIRVQGMKLDLSLMIEE